MTNYPQDEEARKKKRRIGWIFGCSGAVLVTLCVVLFVVFGGFAGLIALFSGEPAGLSVDVQTPASQISIGDTFTISIELSNEGTKNITISEVQLPNDLLQICLVKGVDPYAAEGLDYGDQTGYDFDLTIAPNGRETITFTFEAIQEGDVSGDLDVLAGTKTSSTGIRVVIVSGGTTAGNNQGGDISTGDVIPYQSVVQIIAIIDLDGDLVEGWTGSGTIITNDGLILTNAHVVLSDRYYDVVDLVVAITTQEDQPPLQMFYADVIQADANMDLAVIKIVSKLDGSAANFSELGIQPVPLGDSSTLKLGDPLTIIGYPGIGGETITLTKGEVSGFTSEDPYGNRAYIKTSATIAGGNSGGLAANPQGEIIGVPSAVGTGDIEDAFVDCRRLADTNRDGVIDEYDNCVPTGGFINALRPIRLALPMIEAAKAGQVAIVENAGGQTQEEYNPEGDTILNDEFNDNSNDWSLGTFSAGSADIVSGVMEISLNTSNYLVWSDLPDTYESMILVVNADVAYPAGDGDFGFICGLQDAENFIGLEVSEDGYYVIYKYVNDEYYAIVDWTYSDVVATGGPYTLAAYCGADRLALALNGTLLTETSDPDYIAGRVALAVGTWENPDLIVDFDNFAILKP
jgi:V8-like Glu-specific endopeptidase